MHSYYECVTTTVNDGNSATKFIVADTKDKQKSFLKQKSFIVYEIQNGFFCLDRSHL